MWIKYGAALAALAAQRVFAAPANTRRDNAPTASTKNGTYVGVHSAEYNQDFFLGVPFAQPPVGDLRFRIAQSLNSSWTGTREATAYSDECIGYGSDQFYYPINEDCLYLNVVRPSGYENASLPVAFWIHGGGLSEGGAVDQRYNLSFIVQHAAEQGKPFIGVSTNYRLSAWGFLSGDEVQEAGQTNIGLRDQRLALHWVQENIAGFGGDASKVTIFGESAGGASVGAHLVAYNGRDDSLFRGVIAESGGPIYYGALNTSAENNARYTALVATTPCANSTAPLSCLRALDYETLNAAINTTSFSSSWGLAIDGDIIAGKTSTQVANGDFVHVPLIIGTNSDEGTAFSSVGINDTSDFVAVLTSGGVPANMTSTVLEYYPDVPAVGIPGSPPLGPLPPDFRPPAPYGAQYRRSAAWAGDITFIAPRRGVSEAWAAQGVPVWSYRFNAIPAGISQITAATHFQEVAFVFYNLLGVGYYEPVSTPPFQNMPQRYADLAATMSSAWINFFVEGNPNGADGETLTQGGEAADRWEEYAADAPTNFVFDANVTSHSEPDTFRKEGIAWINAHALDVFSR